VIFSAVWQFRWRCVSNPRKKRFLTAVLTSHQLPHPSSPFSTATGVSDNVGGVKRFVSTRARALRRARHFALVEEVPYQPRFARNRFQVRNSVRPMHLFGPQPRS
jgi:hypothetical protein